MDVTIIIKPKRCSRPGRGRWRSRPRSIRVARGAFPPQKGQCKGEQGGKMKDVILIDAGTGNLRSVQKALESVGANVLLTEDPEKVLSGKRVVLPGVGAFGDFMSGLQAKGLDDVLKE